MEIVDVLNKRREQARWSDDEWEQEAYKHLRMRPGKSCYCGETGEYDPTIDNIQAGAHTE